MNERLADGVYTAVGFGVLSFQRLAVERRAVQRQLRAVADRVDAVVDPLLDEVSAHLPAAPAGVLREVRQAARAGRRVLLGA